MDNFRQLALNYTQKVYNEWFMLDPAQKQASPSADLTVIVEIVAYLMSEYNESVPDRAISWMTFAPKSQWVTVHLGLPEWIHQQITPTTWAYLRSLTKPFSFQARGDERSKRGGTITFRCPRTEDVES